MNNNIMKHPYEISIWEDAFIKKNIKDEKDKNKVIITSSLEEQKVAVIGSDTMDAPSRAVSAQLQNNLNGTSTLTFSLYYQYFDNEKNEFVRNPFVDLIHNETKIKLYYEDGNEDPWHDFIIKDIREESSSYKYTYTATDLFINELSKNGFKIQFDTELENNNGTHTQLVKKILEETDWQVIPTKEESKTLEEWKDYKGDFSDLLRQTKVEPLYAIKLNQDIEATLCDPDRDTFFYGNSFPKEFTIKAGETIFLFQNAVELQTTEAKLFQFLYLKKGNYIVDDNKTILNAPNYQLKEGQNINWHDGVPNITTIEALIMSNDYTGQRLIWNLNTGTDLGLGEHYTVYEKDNKLYNCYTKSEYNVSSMVQSVVTNGQNFNNLVGWSDINKETTSITGGIVPDPKNYIAPDKMITEITDFTSYLKIDKKAYNSGFKDSANNIGTIGKGEKFVIMIDYGTSLGNEDIIYDNNTTVNVRLVRTKEENNLKVETSDIYFKIENIRPSKLTYNIVEFEKGLNITNLKDVKEPLEIVIEVNNSNPIYLKSLEIFKYIPDDTGKPILPSSIPQSSIKTKYYIYDPKDSKNIEAKENKKPDDYTYVYIGYEPLQNGYKPTYDSSFEKIRSINGSESNRFNMIQEVCETFECWAKFIINHESNGKIKNGEKYVLLKEFIGQDNNIGFRYGINLKSIERTVNSDQIVTKLIVKNNTNEFGKDGFCTIARARNNYSGDNTIYDFSYYINTGLLNANEVNNDLYGYVAGEVNFEEENGELIIKDNLVQPQGYIGFLTKYHIYNKDIETLTSLKNVISLSMIFLDAQKQILYNSRNEIRERLVEAKALFEDYFGKKYENSTIKDIQARVAIDKKAEEIYTTIKNYEAEEKRYESLFGNSEEEYDTAKKEFDSITNKLKLIEETKIKLNKELYTKYSRFIQEGSWISEDYYDDNWYYFDALEVMYNSSQPQINYTINVLEISELEEYENYKFKIGDKTYIEDIEFFGYSDYKTKTPLRKEVVVSEVILNLDNPSENQIRVQNYKTQFDELFQRITATTQQLQYASGSYGRAASIVNSNNSINSQVLQNSFDNNSILISNAKDQSVVWNETGISITNLRNPNQVVRLVSGGIVMSTDGGSTWRTGISANGINTSYLTSGQIDVSRINIIGGDGGSGFSSFKWDYNGLTSYWFTDNGYDFNRFVRFDRFGIYGINQEKEELFDKGLKDALESEKSEVKKLQVGVDYIKENGDFGLTWNGFFIKSNPKRYDKTEQNGRIEITSDEDFRVIDGSNIERIKIGYIGNEDNKEIFGLNIKNEDGHTVLQTKSDGTLYLKDKMYIGPNPKSWYDSRVQFGIVETWSDVAQGINPEVIDIDEKIRPKGKYSKILSIKPEGANKDSIRIYDDGLFVSENAYIKGHIEATSGTIGGLDIKTFEENTKSMSIESSAGNTIKKTNGKYYPAYFKLIPKIIGREKPITVLWQYKNKNGLWEKIDDKYGLNKGTTLIYEEEIFDKDLGEFVFIEEDGHIALYFNPLNEDDGNVLDLFDVNGLLTIKASVVLNENDQTQVGNFEAEIKINLIENDETNIYQIRTNNTEILRFYGEVNNVKRLQTSPEKFNIYGIKNNNGKDEYLSDKTNEFVDIFIKKDGKDISLKDTFFDKFIIYNDDLKCWQLDIQGITNLYSGYPGYILMSGQEIFNPETLTVNEQDIFNEINKEESSVVFFRIKDKNNNIYTESKAILRYGNGTETAQLTLNSTNISAAIGEQKLMFSSDGLKIYNGNLEILRFVNGVSDSILRFDSVLNKLSIKGDIQAESGNFIGDIKIGIETDQGVSGGSIQSVNFSEENKTGYKLSSDGTITANSIKLGENAQIEKYLKFKSDNETYTSWFFNPEYAEKAIGLENKNTFILLEKGESNSNGGNSNNQLFKITTDGLLILGSSNNYIKFDGNNQTITSSNFLDSTGYGWQLANDKSIFYNIEAKKCSIKESVIETGCAQSVGGILIVRPSSSIKNIEKISDNTYFITVEDSSGFSRSDTCFIDIDSSKKIIIQITNISNNILTINTQSIINNDIIGKPLISIGNESKKKTTIGIGINSSYVNNNGIVPNAISIFESGIINNEINFNPRIILGKLPKNMFTNFGNYGDSLGGTYGLYAENALIKGAIISSGEVYSSGFNSESNIEMPNKGFKSGTVIGSILLWAGAKGIKDNDIQEAKFLVDSHGNVYAGNGYFDGTVITNSVISKSDIQAARITGSGEGPALIIEDVAKGIAFITKEDEKDKTIFSVDIDKIYSEIPIDTVSIFLHNPDPDNHHSIYITENFISFVKNENFIKEDNESWDINSSIYYDNGLVFSKEKHSNKYFTVGNLQDIGREKNISHIDMFIQENLILGKIDNSNNDIMRFEKQNEGYDLFVLKE